MDGCSDAGDFQNDPIDEQASSTAPEKGTMDHTPMRDSREKVDTSSETVEVMNEVHSAENFLEPPIFDLQCPCGPQCKSFLPNTCYTDVPHSAASPESDRVSRNTSEDQWEVTTASDLYALAREKSSFDAFDPQNSKMEFESSPSAICDKEVDFLECAACVEHNLLFSEDNKLTLQGRISGDGIDQEGLGSQNDILDKLCSSSHPYSGGLRLDELDDDSIFHIVSLMDTRSVKYGLSSVCQRFKAMFDNETYWKTRINMKWQKKYPAIPAPDDFCWDVACMESEDCHRMWSDPDNETYHFMYSCNLYGEVDSVHLMQNGKLLLLGDRNRNLNVIDLGKYNPDWGVPSMPQMNDMLVLSNSTIHKGWIWSLASVDNHLMTGSWDTRVRVFDMNADIKNFSAYKCKSAVLSIYAEENEIVASCFDRRVYFFDRRSDDVSTHAFHKAAVLSVTGNQDYIISGSEDKTVCIYDRRAGKVLTTIMLDSFSLCLSYRDNQLWLGDKSGYVSLFDATRGMFNHVGTYDVGHKDKVTDIIYTPGSIFTCSVDKTLKVLTPTRDPEELKTFHVHDKELARIDYKCGVLASAGGDESIGVWLPKYWQKEGYLL